MIALCLLLVLSPALLMLLLVVRTAIGPYPMFTQQRTGRGGNAFTLYKFRTMRDATGPDGAPLPDAERLTRFGRWLRSTSLDELPSLWNVVRGEMALVGPRPLLPAYLPLYTARQARRHEVLPGITGWAQVNGRNAVSWEERLELDVWYVEHRSLWLDLTILWRTIATVLSRRGVAQPGQATMEPFRGSHNVG